jgi:hypothetical protein
MRNSVRRPRVCERLLACINNLMPEGSICSGSFRSNIWVGFWRIWNHAEIFGEPFAGRMHGAKGDLRTWVVLLCGRIVKFDGFEDICFFTQAFFIKKA